MGSRLWRLFATALCFAGFGIGGVLIGLLAYPAIALSSPAAATRVARTRTLIHQCFRLFVWMLQALGVITLEIRGSERLRRGGQLLLANHPSLVDVVILGSLVRQTNCIVKEALRSNPFTRGPVLGAGYIINSEGPALVDVCVQSLRQGENLLIFPEGTRSVPNRPIRLKRGAANIAVRANCLIRPIIIRAHPPLLPKGESAPKTPFGSQARQRG